MKVFLTFFVLRFGAHVTEHSHNDNLRAGEYAQQPFTYWKALVS